MTDARDLPDLIQWHEGMLLAPQHFQQAEVRNEGLLHYHMGAAAPFHWGVRRLQIDSRALASGILNLSEIEAILRLWRLAADRIPKTSGIESVIDVDPIDMR